MNTLNNLLKNTGILSMAKGVQPVLSYFLIITISKFLGVDGLGEYSIIFSYHAIFQILSAFGLKTLLIREVAQYKNLGKKYLIHSSFIAVPVSFFSIGLMCSIIYFLGYKSNVIIASWLLSISLIAISLNECFEGILTGYQKIKIVGNIWIMENFFRVMVSIIFLRLGYGIFTIVIIFVLTKYLTFFFYLLYLTKFIEKSSYKVDFTFLKHLINLAKQFAFIAVFVTIYWKSDVIMLSKMKGIEEVGFYSAAYRLFWLVLILIGSFVTSLFPIISEYFKTDTGAFEKSIKKAVQYLFLLALPLVILMTGLSREVILMIYGTEYLESILVLQILCWAIIPYGISEIFAHALIASKNQRIDLMVNGIGMVLNILLNYFLIPKFSHIGAALATLISIHFYLVLQLPFIFKNLIKLDFIRHSKYIVKIFVSAVAMGSFILICSRFNIYVISFLSLLIYFSILFLLKAVTEKDKALILGVLKRDA